MKETFWVIVAGGRTFNDYELLKTEMDQFLLLHKDKGIIIVSGCAAGADSLGEIYQEEKGYKIVAMPAEWEKYGKVYAGYKRNEEMARIADACVCFWDGKSRGTKDMIDRANRLKLITKIINY